MTREEKIAEAKRLAESGLNNREIGERLGMTTSCIWKWLNPERAKEKARRDNLRRAEAKREWDHRQAGLCECGAQISDPRFTICSECSLERKEEKAESRCREFIRMRYEGLTNLQIGERAGVSANSVAKAFCKASERYGLDVPPPPYWERGKAAA